jgi:hypothetical protein
MRFVVMLAGRQNDKFVQGSCFMALEGAPKTDEEIEQLEALLAEKYDLKGCLIIQIREIPDDPNAVD